MAEVKYLDKTGLSTVWSKVKGIVTPKADKVSGATAGHLAGLNSSGNLTDSGLPASNIAQKDGSYSGMTVGAAEDLVSAESVASEFTSRITGGSTAVGKGGTALLDKIKGRTLVWNQCVAPDAESAGTLATKDTSVTTENKYVEITTTTSSGRSLNFSRGADIAPGHKALVIWIIKSDYASAPYLRYTKTTNVYGNINISNYVADAWNVIYSIIDEGFMFVGNTGIIPSGSNHIQGKYLSTPLSGGLKAFDLTLMFGAGNEPTIEEFKALYPSLNYDYNPGTLISNAATAIETVGFNLLNDDFEQGVINAGSGENEANASWIRTRTFSSVIPGSFCFCKRPSGSTSLYLYFYGESGSYLGVNERVVIGATGTIFTVPQAAKYVRVTTNLTSYNNDICINISEPSRNGTYEPYWRSELELGLGDIKVKSHNLWDEVWEAGTIATATGANANSQTDCRSKNYIAISPSTEYHITNLGTANRFYVYYYDAGMVFKSYASLSSSTINNYNFTTPSDGFFMRFVAYQASTHYGIVYNQDICINLSDPAFNGRYEPYGDGGVISITGGLKSAGTVYDEISGGKLIKRIESADLGAMVWSRVIGSGFYSDSLTNKEAGYNLICSKYPTYQNSYTWEGSEDKSIGGSTSSNFQNRIYVKDSAYTDSDPATFKASLAGVPLYYELATPIEYELADALPTAMRNDPYGTERRLPEDTAAIVTAPFRADITYSTNIKEAVQSLPQNYINVNSMQDFLAALGTLMGGTWTMRPADGKFDFTFTPNPSNE